MAQPAAGDYYIISRVLSPAGEPLAVTSNGPEQNVTVTTFDVTSPNANQKWTLSDFSGAKYIYLKSDSTVRTDWSSDQTKVIVNNKNGYWAVWFENNGVTIQDAGRTLYWGLSTATIGDEVGLAAAITPNFSQRWYLKPIEG